MTSDASQRKRALIVGAAGQDGTLLSNYLDTLAYEVTKMVRTGLIEPDVAMRPLDVLEAQHVADLIGTLQPHEIYYLAAFHHSSQDRPSDLAALLDKSMEVNFRGLVNVLEAVAQGAPAARVFFASSSLVFGEPPHAPQSEQTPIAPTEAYGISKAAGMGAARLYRRERGLFAVTGILYNHESALRSPAFVSRKIVRAAVAASRGNTPPLRLGSLEAQVDWSAAEDVVRAMHSVLQISTPEDFVIASGVLHTIGDFAEAAFGMLGMDYHQHVEVDDTILQRRIGQVPRQGDPSRLFAATGYRPAVSFEEMVAAMVAAELKGQ